MACPALNRRRAELGTVAACRRMDRAEDRAFARLSAPSAGSVWRVRTRARARLVDVSVPLPAPIVSCRGVRSEPSPASAFLQRSLELHPLGDWTDDSSELVVFREDDYAEHAGAHDYTRAVLRAEPSSRERRRVPGGARSRFAVTCLAAGVLLGLVTSVFAETWRGLTVGNYTDNLTGRGAGETIRGWPGGLFTRCVSLGRWFRSAGLYGLPSRGYGAEA